jgi:hypothetical protein
MPPCNAKTGDVAIFRGERATIDVDDATTRQTGLGAVKRKDMQASSLQCTYFAIYNAKLAAGW